MTPRQYARFKRLAERYARRLIGAHNLEEHGVTSEGTDGRHPTAKDMARLAELYRTARAKARFEALAPESRPSQRDPGSISKLVRAARIRSLREQIRALEKIRRRVAESRNQFDQRRNAAEQRKRELLSELRKINVGLRAVEGRVAATSRADVAGAGQKVGRRLPSRRPRAGDAAELEVGEYGALSRRSVGDGLTPEHSPSFAAIVRSVERRARRKLTPTQKKRLREKTYAIVVKTTSHRRYSRTYGGRNTKTQIGKDASDLERAFQLDRKAWRRRLIDEGHSPRDVDTAFRILDELNRQSARY